MLQAVDKLGHSPSDDELVTIYNEEHDKADKVESYALDHPEETETMLTDAMKALNDY